MTRLLSKIFIIFLITSMLFISFTYTFADTTSEQVDNVYNELSGAAPSGSVTESLQDIANILMVLGVVIAIFKLMQIGIKYMLSTGGTKRSEAKQSLLPWIIGLAVCALWLVIGKTVMDILADGSTGPFDVGSIVEYE